MNAYWQRRYAVPASAPYFWDLDTAELTFTLDGPSLVARICAVGTSSASEGTFLWSWAYAALPAAVTFGIEEVRRFGVENDLPLLTTESMRGGRPEGLEVTAIAGRILDADGIFIDESGDILLFFTLHDFERRPQ